MVLVRVRRHHANEQDTREGDCGAGPRARGRRARRCRPRGKIRWVFVRVKDAARSVREGVDEEKICSKMVSGLSKEARKASVLAADALGALDEEVVRSRRGTFPASAGTDVEVRRRVRDGVRQVLHLGAVDRYLI